MLFHFHVEKVPVQDAKLTTKKGAEELHIKFLFIFFYLKLKFSVRYDLEHNLGI